MLRQLTCETMLIVTLTTYWVCLAATVGLNHPQSEFPMAASSSVPEDRAIEAAEPLQRVVAWER